MQGSGTFTYLKDAQDKDRAVPGRSSNSRVPLVLHVRVMLRDMDHVWLVLECLRISNLPSLLCLRGSYIWFVTASTLFALSERGHKPRVTSKAANPNDDFTIEMKYSMLCHQFENGPYAARSSSYIGRCIDVLGAEHGYAGKRSSRWMDAV